MPPSIYLFINARTHNTPHRTVLEDFPHTALQSNSHCMWQRKNYVLFLVQAMGRTKDI